MNMLRLALVVGALGLGLMAAARAGEEKAGKPDIRKKLVGKWEMVKLTAAKGGLLPTAVLEFTKDGKTITTVENNGKKGRWEGTYKVEGKWLTVTRKLGVREQTQKFEVVKVDDKELVVSHEKYGKQSLKRMGP